MNSITDFNKLVVNLIEIIKSLITIEKDKLNAVTRNNLEKLNVCIKDEQVQVMKLRGLDKKREKLLNSLGYDGLTFRQIISTLDGDEKNEAQKLFNNLKKATDDFNSINSTVKTAIEVNLHSIDIAIKKLNGIPKDENIAVPLNNGLSGKLV
ncbi:MAG: flagellar protein FlgN [Clostridia bacterium]|jgi:hypothetical protein|nr:flagellar protein FlgN [Clostridia bacterium]MCI1999895.1 flagellar protein FlgN [Clostridia bacterium]MCI2014189.1 flagellar protein FlgN [Clostridia bacterium]